MVNKLPSSERVLPDNFSPLNQFLTKPKNTFFLKGNYLFLPFSSFSTFVIAQDGTFWSPPLLFSVSVALFPLQAYFKSFAEETVLGRSAIPHFSLPSLIRQRYSLITDVPLNQTIGHSAGETSSLQESVLPGNHQLPSIVQCCKYIYNAKSFFLQTRSLFQTIKELIFSFFLLSFLSTWVYSFTVQLHFKFAIFIFVLIKKGKEALHDVYSAVFLTSLFQTWRLEPQTLIKNFNVTPCKRLTVTEMPMKNMSTNNIITEGI